MGDAERDAKYEQLMLATATCELKSKGISLSCKPHQELVKFRMKHGHPSVEQRYAIGLRHLRHERPVVRYQAADLAGGFHSSRPDAVPEVIAAAQAEKDPWVLGQLLSILPVDKDHPEAGELLLKGVSHEHANVREASVRRLGHPRARLVSGAVEKLIEVAEKDPSPKIRQTACYVMGRTGAADKLVPFYRKLRRKDLEPRMYQLCVEGLNALWTSPPEGLPPSKAAYELSLDLLKQTPRSHTWPAMHVVGDFENVPRGAPKWYRREDVAQALAAIAIDTMANANTRGEAVSALATLKGVEQLKQIKAKVAGKTDSGSTWVTSRVDQALRELK